MMQVFEGPLCCNTGVCGTDPDQALVDFTADLDWLKRQGVEVHRANLAQDPTAFADSEVARAFVKKVGAQGLPLIVSDGVTVVTGRYPSRGELARIAGVSESESDEASTAATSENSCDPDSGCCAPTATISADAVAAKPR